jgi:4-hydroxy 2-oxovalerate aldolase
LSGILKDKEILLIGPGKSSVMDSNRIIEFVKEKKPITISVNFVPNYVEPDYVFISNPLRYSLVIPEISGKKTKIIGTSNVTPAGRPFDFTVRYDSLITQGAIWDNSLAIFLNLIRKVGVMNLTLAGFDGFKNNPAENYVDVNFDFSKDFEYLSSVNKSLKVMISDCRKDVNITFLTDSLYDGENDV